MADTDVKSSATLWKELVPAIPIWCQWLKIEHIMPTEKWIKYTNRCDKSDNCEECPEKWPDLQYGCSEDKYNFKHILCFEISRNENDFVTLDGHTQIMYLKNI